MKKIIALFFITTNTFAQNSSPDYPIARIDSTKDIYFGQTVYDPYRSLENDTLATTIGWVKEETEYSGSYLRKLKNKYSPENQLKSNSHYNFGTIHKSGIYYFDFIREGADSKPCLYIKKEIDDAGRMIVDPDDYKVEWKDKVAIKEFQVSDDNKYIAFSLSYNGSDWHEIHVKSLYPFRKEDDVIKGVKFSNIEWYKDGFFYLHYPMSGNIMLDKTQHPSVCYHKLGTTQDSDLLVYDDRIYSNPIITFGKISSPKEDYLIICHSNGYNNKVLAISLQPDFSNWKTDTIITSNQNANFNVVGIYNNKFLVSTTLGAPHGRLVMFEKNKKNVASEFVPEHLEVLKKTSIIGNKVVCIYLDDIDYVSVSFDSTGTPAHKITFPVGSSVDGFEGNYSSPTTIFYQYSFLYPPIAYEYNVDYEGVSLVKKTQVIPFRHLICAIFI